MATPTKPTGTFAEGPNVDRFLVTFYRVAVSNFEIRMVIDVPCLSISLCRCVVYGFFSYVACFVSSGTVSSTVSSQSAETAIAKLIRRHFTRKHDIKHVYLYRDRDEFANILNVQPLQALDTRV